MSEESKIPIDKQIREQNKKSIRACLANSVYFKILPKYQKVWLVNKIELGIHNSNIRESIKNFIQSYWNNQSFVHQYSTISFDVKTNLDVKSSILRNKTNKVKSYLSKGVVLYTIMKWMKTSPKKFKSKFSRNLLALDDDILTSIFETAGAINPKQLGFMNYTDLNPYLSQKYLEEIELRSKQKIKEKSTKQYT